uniref:Integrase catalytic domain-containing protein n=1 Tax=Trichuris muris TaxID=70415 RepID=A0A5S6Q7F1_TRIMR
MGTLSAARGNAEHVFQNVGIDFARPVYIRANGCPTKPHIHLLTCLAVSAAHLQLVHDMSADVVMQATKRFFTRRGIPRGIYSDNFRTFKRVAKDMQTVFDDCSQRKVQEHIASHRVTWKFITERAPWAGGAWERLTLKKTLHKSLLIVEEMTTMLCEAESQINARPLTIVGDEPKEQELLTPFYFFHGRSPGTGPTVEQDS